jgi:hypothetical protein
MMTLKPYLMLSGLMVASVLGATSASAQTVVDRVSQQARVDGIAPAVCRINATDAVSLDNTTYISQSPTSGEVRISQLVDPLTSVPEPMQVSLAMSAVCNHSHRLIVRSLEGGLVRSGGAVAGAFASQIAYTLEGRWAGAQDTARITTPASGLDIAVLDGSIGTIELNISSDGGGIPLAAGQYRDLIVVEFVSAS